MTELRRRLLEDLPLRNYSPRTQEAYVAQVAQFARHFGRSPDQLGAEEVRAYQLHLIHERKWSWSSFNQAVAALRFFLQGVESLQHRLLLTMLYAAGLRLAFVERSKVALSSQIPPRLPLR